MAHRHPRYLLVYARGIYLYMYVYTWGSLQFAIEMPFFLDMTASMAHRHPRYLLVYARGIYLYMYVYTWGSLQFAIEMPFFLDMTAWASCFPSEGAMF